MDNERRTTELKKAWSMPRVTVYGDVERLTQASKFKQPGSSDDFHVNGISDAPPL
jgi:hypothetical protein